MNKHIFIGLCILLGCLSFSVLAQGQDQIPISGIWRMMPEDSGGFVENDAIFEMELIGYPSTPYVFGDWYIYKGQADNSTVIAEGAVVGTNYQNNVTVTLISTYSDTQASNGIGTLFTALVGNLEQTEQGLRSFSGDLMQVYGNPATLRDASWSASVPFKMWLVG